MDLILILRRLFLYLGSYTCITDPLLVLQSLCLYFGFLVFRILYLYYGAYSCISDLILVLRSLCLYFRSYSCISDLFLYFRSYTYITELIQTYSYTKVLVDTISRNI